MHILYSILQIAFIYRLCMVYIRAPKAGACLEGQGRSILHYDPCVFVYMRLREVYLHHPPCSLLRGLVVVLEQEEIVLSRRALLTCTQGMQASMQDACMQRRRTHLRLSGSNAHSLARTHDRLPQACMMHLCRTACTQGRHARRASHAHK